jgi:GTP-binding protein
VIEATFVKSAAAARDLPREGLAELALVGRSNVGKSSLINALVRQQVARTSAAPGKTRLANFFRVRHGGAQAFYLVDLPGYGYARGRAAAAREFDALTREYFERAGERDRATMAALLLVDSRHPGLAADLDAWRWIGAAVDAAAIVATKIDKLSRAERQRAMERYEAVFEHPVLPVSAVTGEGLDDLWTLIDRLNNLPNRRPHSHSSRSPQKGTAATGAPPRPTLPRPRSKR